MKELVVAIIDADLNDRTLFKKYCNDSISLSCSLAVKSVEYFYLYYKATGIPDIILYDFDQQTDGVSNISKEIAKLKSTLPNVELIILTNDTNENSVINSFKAGACGYLLKGISRSELTQYINYTRNGGAAVSPRISRFLVQRLNYEKVLSGNDHWESLSRRQIEIIDYIAEGLNAGEIAEKIGISINGIQYHIRAIYSKLNVENKTSLLKKYFMKSLN